MSEQELEKKEILVKYAMLLQQQSQTVVVQAKTDFAGDVKIIDENLIFQFVEDESVKVIEKLMKSKLNPNERKKVVSQKSGKWLSMSDDYGMIGKVVCLQ